MLKTLLTGDLYKGKLVRSHLQNTTSSRL